MTGEVGEIIAAVARARRRGGARARRCASARPPVENLRVDPGLIAAAPALRRRRGPRGAAGRRRNISPVAAAPGGGRAAPGLGRARGRPAGRGRRCAGRLGRRSTRPAAAASYPSSVLMGAIPARVAGVGAARRRLAARRVGRPTTPCSPPARSPASRRSTRSAAPRRSPRSPSAPRRSPPVDVIVGPGQPLRDRGQAAARRARSGSTGSRARASSPWSPTATADPELLALDLCAQAEHGDDGMLAVDLARPGAARRASPSWSSELAAERPSVADAPLALDHGARARARARPRRRARARAPRARLPGRRRGQRPRPGRRAACSSAPAARPRSATTRPAPTTCCRPAAPRASAARWDRAHSCAARSVVHVGSAAAAELAPHVAALAARRGLSGPRRVGAGEGEAMTQTRTAKVERETRETKVSVELALDGGEVAVSTGVGFFDHMLELLGRHGRLGLAVEATRRPRDRRPPHGRGRRHRARPGARRGARRSRRDPPLRLRRGADGRGAGDVRDRHLRSAAVPVRAPTCRRSRSPASTPSSRRSSSAPWRRTRS